MNLDITDRTWVQIKGCFNIIGYLSKFVNISKQLNLDQTKIGNTQWTDICTCMYDVFLIKKDMRKRKISKRISSHMFLSVTVVI